MGPTEHQSNNPSLPEVSPLAVGRRHPRNTNPEAEAEIKLYMDKLREIVPLIPKDRRISKLELIQHVIDYICHLQHALEEHPTLKDETIEALTNSPALNGALQQFPRQPLGVLCTANTLPVINARRDTTKTTSSRSSGPICHTSHSHS